MITSFVRRSSDGFHRSIYPLTSLYTHQFLHTSPPSPSTPQSSNASSTTRLDPPPSSSSLSTTILLMSGGIRSTALLSYYQYHNHASTIIPVFCNYGQDEATEAMTAARALSYHTMPEKPAAIEEALVVLNVDKDEKEKQIERIRRDLLQDSKASNTPILRPTNGTLFQLFLLCQTAKNLQSILKRAGQLLRKENMTTIAIGSTQDGLQNPMPPELLEYARSPHVKQRCLSSAKETALDYDIIAPLSALSTAQAIGLGKSVHAHFELCQFHCEERRATGEWCENIKECQGCKERGMSLFGKITN